VFKEIFNNKRIIILFCLMFSIVCLLNINYSLLRSARNALAVVDLGHGASSIPFFELCGTMPTTLLMVYCLTRLLNRFSIYKVFLLTLTTFCLFFLSFSTIIYPSLPNWKMAMEDCSWLYGHLYLASVMPQLLSMIFFVMAELWKIALLTVLFWGMVNQYIPLKEAKHLYAPLMLGGSVGTMISGPLIKLCTAEVISNGSWARSLNALTILICCIGIIAALLYSKLWAQFAEDRNEREESEEPVLSMWDSIRLCIKSKYLLLLAWMTVADYIAYTLGEVVFLDILKQKYSDPLEYFNYNGQLAFWSGALTALSALVITPYLLSHSRWVTACIISPLCLLVTEGAFFLTLWGSSSQPNLDLLVLFGTLFFCVVRAAKYTLFDASKEISFLLLPPIEKMQGKLIIDGVCSRTGRASASLISVCLNRIFGGVIASGCAAGCLALGIGLSCALASIRLGMLVTKRSKKEEHISSPIG
jgi:AAA family ATP:ADP antiporter